MKKAQCSGATAGSSGRNESERESSWRSTSSSLICAEIRLNWSRRRAFRSVSARHATIEAVALSTPYAPSINAGRRRGAHSPGCCHTKYSAARRLILLAARQVTALRTRTPSLSDQLSSSWNVSLIVSPEGLLWAVAKCRTDFICFPRSEVSGAGPPRGLGLRPIVPAPHCPPVEL